MSRPIAPSLVVACVLLLGAGCSREVEGLDLPWKLPSPGVEKATNERAAPADCDDLPELSAEEEARPPFAPPRLEKSSPRADPPGYRALDDVTLADAARDKVDAIDAAYARRTGKHVTVTSGTRDAVRQAKAMYKMLRLGGDPMRLYRNKEAAREIKAAYDRARAAGKAQDDVVGAMYSVLQGQIARGVYISAHLRAGAVDIRSRDMSPSDKRAFAAAVAEAKSVSLLEESTPPHFHLQID
jgi:hypothetical protein